MTEFFYSAVRRLFGPPKLLGYESAALEGWRSVLDDSGRRVLDGQMEGLLSVQRIHGVTGFYTRRPVLEDPNRKFACRRVEVACAVVTLRADQFGVVLSCVLFVQRGRLAWLEVRPTISGDVRQIRADAFERSVAVLHDPCAVDPDGNVAVALPEWIGLLARRVAITEVSAPALGLAERDRVLGALHVSPPQDVLDLLSVADGFRIGSFEIRGATEFRQVPAPDGAYLMVASTDDGVVYALKLGFERSVYKLDPSSEVADASPCSLRAEMERELLGRS